MTFRNEVVFTQFSPALGLRVQQSRIYYREHRLTIAGAERMLRRGAPVSPGDFASLRPAPGSIVERVEVVVDAR